MTPRARGDDRRPSHRPDLRRRGVRARRARSQAANTLRQSMTQAVVGERRQLAAHAVRRRLRGRLHRLDRAEAERDRRLRRSRAFTSYVVALLTLLDRLQVAVRHQRHDPARPRRGREHLRPARPTSRRPTTAPSKLERARGELAFERVSLRYAGAERDALTDVTPDDRARRNRRAGRPFGQRQDVAGQPDPALLRADRRPHVARRPRHRRR